MPKNILKNNWPVLTLIVTVILGYIVSIYLTHNTIVQQTNVLNQKIDGVNKDLGAKVDGLNAKIEQLDLRTTKLDGAVKTLGDQQSNPLKQVIHDLLASAQNALPRNPDIAARAINVASSLIATLKREKRPAEAQYFQSVVSVINELHKNGQARELKIATFQAQQELAEYRSALQIGKQIGTVFNCVPGSSPSSVFGAVGDQTKADRLIQSVTITNCPQILDGFTWKNVVFINSRISYKGGPVILDHVAFLNCIFQTEQNDEGIRLLQYAALDENTLRVKPEFFNPS